MPYRRKRGFRRRRFGRKRGGYTTWGATKFLARKAYSGFKYVKRLINVEKKFFDVSSADNVTSTGAITSLTNIGEGNDYNQRDGNSILCQSVGLRAVCKINPSATTTWVRCMIFADNDQRGVDPAVTDILETASYISPLNHVVGKRFKVLYDKVMSLSINGTEARNFKVWIPYNRHVKYTSTAGADASAYEGNLFLLLISNEPTNTPVVSWYHRLRYTDN